MKRIALLLAFALPFLASNMILDAQVVEFQLEKEGKVKTIKSDGYISLDQDISGDSLDLGYISYYGDVVSADKESIVITPYYKSKYWSKEDGSSYESSYSWPYDNADQLTLPTNTIASIHYQSNFQEGVNMASGILAVAGLAAAFYAPLFSINYRTWDFNQQRYYTIAGIGLATFTVTLPIAIFTSGKDFELKDMFDSGDTMWRYYE